MPQPLAIFRACSERRSVSPRLPKRQIAAQHGETLLCKMACYAHQNRSLAVCTRSMSDHQRGIERFCRLVQKASNRGRAERIVCERHYFRLREQHLIHTVCRRHVLQTLFQVTVRSSHEPERLNLGESPTPRTATAAISKRSWGYARRFYLSGPSQA